MTVSDLDPCHGNQSSQAHAPQKRCRKAMKGDLPIEEFGDRKTARYDEMDFMSEGGLSVSEIDAVSL
jgi:hypothetical protein